MRPSERPAPRASWARAYLVRLGPNAHVPCGRPVSPPAVAPHSLSQLGDQPADPRQGPCERAAQHWPRRYAPRRLVLKPRLAAYPPAVPRRRGAATHPAGTPAFPFPSRADANGVYTGECTTYALSGFVRGQGEADAAMDRLWAKETAAAAAAHKLI